jgi:hypothetical protein
MQGFSTFQITQGNSSGFWALGVYVRLGIEFNSWLGVEGELSGGTWLLGYSGRAALMVDVVPIERLTVAAGICEGANRTPDFGTALGGSSTAQGSVYTAGLLRADYTFVTSGHEPSDARRGLTVGIVTELGPDQVAGSGRVGFGLYATLGFSYY